MSLTIPSSSAEVIRLRPFAVARDSWLKTALAHPILTPANKTVCAALYFYFNCKHYRQTGELVAWPSQDTLMAATDLSKSTVADSVDQIEHFGLLDRERGRWDRAAQKRGGNTYRARYGIRT
jgi:Replication protein C N-terminal domain